VVALGLVRAGQGEFAERLVECISPAELTREERRIASTLPLPRRGSQTKVPTLSTRMLRIINNASTTNTNRNQTP
jgi:hypothetical protein